MKKGLALVVIALGCGDVANGGLGGIAGGSSPDALGDSASGGSEASGETRVVEAVTGCRGSGAPVSLVALVNGDGHACTIGPSGDVYCWGRNELGQLGQRHDLPVGGVQRVLGLPDSATTLAIGRHFTCALVTGGEVACWGMELSSAGLPGVEPGTSTVYFEDAIDVAAHGDVVCAVTSDGAVWCRRSGLDAHVGRGAWRLHEAPGDVRAIAIHTGGLCVVTAAGEAWCGSLEAGGARDRGGFVSGLDAAANEVVLGNDIGCALTDARTVLCWDRADAETRATVVALDGDTRALVSGDDHLCALNSYGRVHCWGDNRSGQVAPERMAGRVGTPLELPFDVEVLGLVAGPAGTCALLSGGGSSCWGDWLRPHVRPAPGAVLAPGLTIPLPRGASQIDAGRSQSCAVLWDKTVACWGDPGLTGGDVGLTVPVAVPGVVDAVTVSAGEHAGCAVDRWNGVRCWEAAFEGDDTSTGSVEPSYTSLAGSSVALGAGLSCLSGSINEPIVCAWLAPGDAFDFANGAEWSPYAPFEVSRGYINDPGDSAVSVGERHGCVVRQFVPFCWGDNSHGQVDPSRAAGFEASPVMLDDFAGLRDIAAGARHTCVVYLDGGVRCFGDDSLGQLGDGVVSGGRRLGTVVDLGGPAWRLVAGTSHTCAVREDGQVFCWGANLHGQVGVAPSPSRAVPVAVPGITRAIGVALGETHTCVLLDSGVVSCFGLLPRRSAAAQPSDETWNFELWTCGGTQNGHMDLCATPPTTACDDQNPCTDDHCGGELGCVHAPRTGSCDDGDPSTDGELCSDGQCVHPADLAPVELPSEAAACGDPLSREGDVCDGNGRCFGGACVAPAEVAAITNGAHGLYLLSSTGALHRASPYMHDGYEWLEGAQQTEESVAGGIVAVYGSSSYDCVVTPSGAPRCFGSGLYQLLMGPNGFGTFYSDNLLIESDETLSPVAELALGERHLCARLLDGSVACLGWNDQGQLGAGPVHVTSLTPVSGLEGDVTHVVVGDRHTCALKDGGDVWCWGDDGYGPVGDGTLVGGGVPHRVEGLGNVTQLSAEAASTCAVVDGEVWCWGEVHQGMAATPLPQRISGFSLPVVEVDVARTHACARLTDGSVECWGGLSGQGLLGDGRFEGSEVPVPTTPLPAPAVQLSVAGYSSAVLLENGAVYVWSDYFEPAVDERGNRQGEVATAVTLPGAVGKATALFSGEDRQCAVTADGATVCWGIKTVPDPASPDSRANRVGSATPWIEESFQYGPTALKQVIGNMHRCTLYQGGTVACAGRDQEGQLGNGEPRQDSEVPVSVALPEPATDLEAAADGTCAIGQSGALYCWGANGHRLFGSVPSQFAGWQDPAGPSASPRLIEGVAGPVKALSLSGNIACIIVETGDVYCAGDNSNGATGALFWDDQDQFELLRVEGLPGRATAVATAYEHTCAAFEGGGVTCWGDNSGTGLLGAGRWDWETARMHVFGLSSPVVALQANYNSMCALTQKGRVVCWGAIPFKRPIEREYGLPWSQGAVPGLLDGEVMDLRVTSSAACVLTTAGAVKCWGSPYGGQLGDGRAFTPAALGGIWPGSPSVLTLDFTPP
jgi:alpha-tubulin suppressor-like RCC1 family protein